MNICEFTALTNWKPIYYKGREFPYFISKYGEIQNTRGKFLKPYLRGQRKGTYPCVKLCINGDRISVDVHRLVALHFIPNPESKPEVNHLDLDHNNPIAYNLEWCTRSENEQHKYFMTAHLEFQSAYEY